VEGKTEIIRGYGLNASGAELIATRDIANGDVVAVFGKTAMMWTSKETHESQELVDETNDDSCDKFQYNVRGDNPGNKSLTLYIVPEKYAELVLSIKKSKSLAKALRHCSMQSGNGQFANHTCYTVHRNINIEIVTVQAAADNEYSNPITTVKLDVIVILRADRGIEMGEWIKTRYTDVQLNLDRIFACGCCFHAGECQPQQTESMLAQFMQTQAPNLATAENIVVGSRVYLTCGGVLQMGTVSKIKNGGGNENQISIQMQDKLVEVGQSWVTRNEKEDGFVLEKLGVSHQGTDRITSHQDWRDILAPGKMMTDEILGTLLTVSIYGHSKKLQLPTSLAKT